MQNTGNKYEHKACKHLLLRGWQLICRNYGCRMGEIDLIMRNFWRTTLCFIEVRYRTHHSFGGSAPSIDTHKQTRLIRTAEHFLNRHPKYLQYKLRFDVICFDGQHKIDWIQDAFRVQ